MQDVHQRAVQVSPRTVGHLEDEVVANALRQNRCRFQFRDVDGEVVVVLGLWGHRSVQNFVNRFTY